MERLAEAPTTAEVERAVAVLQERGVLRIGGYSVEALRRQIAVDPNARQAKMMLVLRAQIEQRE